MVDRSGRHSLHARDSSLAPALGGANPGTCWNGSPAPKGSPPPPVRGPCNENGVQQVPEAAAKALPPWHQLDGPGPPNPTWEWSDGHCVPIGRRSVSWDWPQPNMDGVCQNLCPAGQSGFPVNRCCRTARTERARPVPGRDRAAAMVSRLPGDRDGPCLCRAAIAPSTSSRFPVNSVSARARSMCASLCRRERPSPRRVSLGDRSTARRRGGRVRRPATGSHAPPKIAA